MSSSDSGESAKTISSQHGVTTRPKKMRRSIDPERPSDIVTYNIKVPSFSPDDPELWFAILEGQFNNHGIYDDAIKFNTVMTKLDIVHAKAVKDIIIHPPHRNRYEKLKTELIRRLTDSHEQKVKQLLTHEELGDRKPSQFLRHLQDLAGPNIPYEFLRTIWCNRLPQSIQTVLASQTSQNLEQLADLADRIQDITAPVNVAAASASSTRAEPNSNTSDEIAALRKMVERLSAKLDEHTRESRSRRHDNPDQLSNRPSLSRSRTRSSSSYRQNPICWYHSTFKSLAHKCHAPCAYNKSGNAKGNRQ